MSKIDQLAGLAQALGQTADSDAHWQAIAKTMQELFGYGLLTGLVYLKAQRLMRRIYTSDEQVSPLGGFKATGKGPWSLRVLDQGLPYVGRDEADIRTVFSEAEDLIARGLHAVLNVPIWHGGEVIGSVNMLGRRGAYDEVEIPWIQLVSGVCVPAFLAARETALQAASGLDISALQSV